MTLRGYLEQHFPGSDGVISLQQALSCICPLRTQSAAVLSRLPTIARAVPGWPVQLDTSWVTVHPCGHIQAYLYLPDQQLSIPADSFAGLAAGLRLSELRLAELHIPAEPLAMPQAKLLAKATFGSSNSSFLMSMELAGAGSDAGHARSFGGSVLDLRLQGEHWPRWDHAASTSECMNTCACR